jgi:hypothetical protein
MQVKASLCRSERFDARKSPARLKVARLLFIRSQSDGDKRSFGGYDGARVIAFV